MLKDSMHMQNQYGSAEKMMHKSNPVLDNRVLHGFLPDNLPVFILFHFGNPRVGNG